MVYLWNLIVLTDYNLRFYTYFQQSVTSVNVIVFENAQQPV